LKGSGVGTTIWSSTLQATHTCGNNGWKVSEARKVFLYQRFTSGCSKSVLSPSDVNECYLNCHLSRLPTDN
jgi:hypothetical protein